jgi:hypothetical protein
MKKSSASIYVSLRRYLLSIGVVNRDIHILFEKHSQHELEELDEFALIMLEEFDNDKFVSWFENAKAINKANIDSLVYIILIHYFEFISCYNSEKKKSLQSVFLNMLAKKNMTYNFTVTYSKVKSNAKANACLQKKYFYAYLAIAMLFFYGIRHFVLGNNVLLTLNFLFFAFVIFNRKQLITFSYQVVIFLKTIFLIMYTYLWLPNTK